MQLHALGIDARVESYGVRLTAGEHVMVVTAWPWTAPVREADPRLYNLSPDVAAPGVVSAANDAGSGAAITGGHDRKVGPSTGHLSRITWLQERDVHVCHDVGHVAGLTPGVGGACPLRITPHTRWERLSAGFGDEPLPVPPGPVAAS